MLLHESFVLTGAPRQSVVQSYQRTSPVGEASIALHSRHTESQSNLDDNLAVAQEDEAAAADTAIPGAGQSVPFLLCGRGRWNTLGRVLRLYKN